MMSYVRNSSCQRSRWAKTHSRLDNVLGASRSPVDVGGVALSEDGDRLAVDDELAILSLDGAFEATVDGVVLEHVDLGSDY